MEVCCDIYGEYRQPQNIVHAGPLRRTQTILETTHPSSSFLLTIQHFERRMDTPDAGSRLFPFWSRLVFSDTFHLFDTHDLIFFGCIIRTVAAHLGPEFCFRIPIVRIKLRNNSNKKLGDCVSFWTISSPPFCTN